MLDLTITYFVETNYRNICNKFIIEPKVKLRITQYRWIEIWLDCVEE